MKTETTRRGRASPGGGRLCGDVRRRGDGDKLAQDVLGRLQVVLGDHQGFLDVLDGVALRHQAFDLPVQRQASRAPQPQAAAA